MLPTVYTSNKSIQEMLYCISEVIESRILNTLLDLMELMGVPIKSDLHVAKNATYSVY